MHPVGRRRTRRRGGDSTTIFVDVFLTVLVVLMLASRDRTELGHIGADALAEAAHVTAVDAAVLVEVVTDGEHTTVVCTRGCDDDTPRTIAELAQRPPTFRSDGTVALRVAADVPYGDAVDARRALREAGLVIMEQGAVR